MDILSITLGLSQTICGLICVGFSIPLLRGRVKPNPIYGVRIGASFESADAWYAINRFWARRMIPWACALTLLGLVSFFVPLQPHLWATGVLAGLDLLCVLTPAVQTWFFARRFETP